VYKTVSLLDYRSFIREVFMWSTFKSLYTSQILCAALCLAFSGNAKAAVNVFGTPDLQREFIAVTTSYFEAIITPSPYFPGTYTLTLTNKITKVEQPIQTGTAFGECIAYGFGNGMETEREQDIDLIWSVHARDAWDGTCAGYALPATPTISTSTCQGFCMNTYGVVVSTISQRWGYVFSSTGARVYP
jgi:hypothetical protein